MSLLAGLQFREQLPTVVADELDQVLSTLQTAWAYRESGATMALLLGLQFREQLPPIVADELDQLTAAIQVAFNSHQTVASVQRGTIAIGNGTYTGTATIAAVTSARALLSHLWTEGGGTSTDFTNGCVRLELTNDTTVTARRQGATNAITVGFEVVEFNVGVVRLIQRGIVSVAAAQTTGTDTLPTAVVDLSKAWLTCLGHDSGGGQLQNGYFRLALTNTTTVTASRAAAGGSIARVHYQLVEFI